MSERLSSADLKHMLAGRIEALAAVLAPEGRKHGRYWIAKNPSRNDHRAGSFYIWLSGAPGAWRDDASGEKGDVIDLIAMCATSGDKPAAFTWARRFLGLDRAQPADIIARKAIAQNEFAARRAQEDQDIVLRRKRAFELYLSGTQWRQSPVETYLRWRGIDVDALSEIGSLRFGRRVDYFGGGARHAGPAMLAKFTDFRGEFSAVHVTFLREDGRGKADVEKPKLISGSYSGCAIRLTRGLMGIEAEAAAYTRTRAGLMLGEGIESTLSAACARPDIRAWAVGSLGNFGKQPRHGCAANFIVLAENDAKPQARAALEQGLAALEALGLPVSAARPFSGNDMSDLLAG